MERYIFERVRDVGEYILDTKATVRQAALVFGVSKSTVHKDVTERLPRIDRQLAENVRKVLDFNKSIRHIRGGEAMRRKFRSQRDESSHQQENRQNM